MSWPDSFDDYVGICKTSEGMLKRLITNMAIKKSIKPENPDEIVFTESTSVLHSDGSDGETSKKDWIWRGFVDYKHNAFAVTSEMELQLHLQGFFSDDFQIMYIVQDGDMAMLSFYWRVSRPSPVCPELFPGDSMQAITEKMKQAIEFLKDAEVLAPGKQPVLTCSVGFGELHAVRILEHTYAAKVVVVYSWPVELSDVYRYTFDRKTWVPQWLPGKPIVLNGASNDSINVSDGRLSMEKVTGRDGKVQVCAQLRFIIKGEFHEVYELENFPFDTQLLQVHLDLQTNAKIRMKQMDSPIGQLLKTLSSSSWTCEGVDQGMDSSGDCVYASCSVKRNPHSYVVRVLFILVMLQVLTLGVFSLDAEEHVADRISIGITMLLTAMAYISVIASLLPELGYLTLLDRAVMSTLNCIAVITVQVTVNAEAAELFGLDPEEIDTWCRRTDVVALVVLGLSWFYQIKFQILPQESEKIRAFEASIKRNSCDFSAEESSSEDAPAHDDELPVPEEESVTPIRSSIHVKPFQVPEGVGVAPTAKKKIKKAAKKSATE